MSRRVNDRTPNNRGVDEQTSIMMVGLTILLLLSLYLSIYFTLFLSLNVNSFSNY